MAVTNQPKNINAVIWMVSLILNIDTCSKKNVLTNTLRDVLKLLFDSANCMYMHGVVFFFGAKLHSVDVVVGKKFFF